MIEKRFSTVYKVTYGLSFRLFYNINKPFKRIFLTVMSWLCHVALHLGPLEKIFVTVALCRVTSFLGPFEQIFVTIVMLRHL